PLPLHCHDAPPRPHSFPTRRSSDLLGIERYHLSGYSLGAAAAAALAAEHGDRVRSLALVCGWARSGPRERLQFDVWQRLFAADRDRKSTRLNSSHRTISYAVFCLKK